MSLRANARSLECETALSLRTNVRSFIDVRAWITERFQDVSLRST